MEEKQINESSTFEEHFNEKNIEVIGVHSITEEAFENLGEKSIHENVSPNSNLVEIRGEGPNSIDQTENDRSGIKEYQVPSAAPWPWPPICQDPRVYSLILVTRGLRISRELTLDISPFLVVVLIILEIDPETSFVGVVSPDTICTCLDIQTSMAMRSVSVLSEVSASDTNLPIHDVHPFVSCNAG